MINITQSNTTTGRQVPVRVYEQGSNLRIQRPRFPADPLHDKTPVHGIGPANNTTMAIISPCPAPDEFSPLTSETGIRFRGLCSAGGLFIDGVWRTHLVDRHVKGGLQSFSGAQTLLAQTDAFWSELAELKRRGVTTILGLGTEVKDAFGVTGTLDAQRGSVNLISLERRGPAALGEPFDLVFLPTLHPLSVIGQSGFYEKNGMKVSTANILVADIEKATGLSETGYQAPVENFNMEPTIEDLEKFVLTLGPDTLLAVDLETTALAPHDGSIVVIGFAADGENAISIPLLGKNGTPYWTPDEMPRVVAAINHALQTPLMFQNGYFDVYWMREKGFKVPKFGIKHDTLVLHHTTNPELDHDIGFIASIYAKTSYWKDVFKHRKVPILQMDQIEMRRYNLRDCTVLHQCLPGLMADLEELGPRTVQMYHEEAIPMIEVCLELHSSGVPFSEKRRKLWETSVEVRVDGLELQCRELAGLPPEFSLNSDMDMRLFLFGEVGAKYAKADELLQKKPGTKVYAALKALDVVRQVKPLWLPPGGFAGRKTDTGMTKVDEQGRLSLQVRAQNRLEALKELVRPQQMHLDEAAAIEKLLVFLERYGELAEAVKLQETYVKWKPWADGRVHSDWKSFGTATGRLSSKGPNAQNWPKKGFGHGVRELFEAPEGWAFLSMDYSNLEVGTMAYTSKEPNLIRVFEQGINLHDLNTEALFGITPKDPSWELCRAAAKVFQFGIQYGGGTREIFEKINLKVPSLRLTFGGYSKCVDRYFASNPVYTAWRDDTQSQVKQSREVRTPFGRVRRFYGPVNDIVKEALNFPCQSAAASVINLAAVRLMRMLWAGGWKSRLVLQIHDQLVFLCPLAEIVAMKDLMQNEMSRPVDWNGEMKSFPVDPEAGYNFGQLEKWGDFVKGMK